MSERLTSCWSVVVVVCRRAAAERAETRHDDQTQRDQDDLRTQTQFYVSALCSVELKNW